MWRWDVFVVGRVFSTGEDQFEQNLLIISPCFFCLDCSNEKKFPAEIGLHDKEMESLKASRKDGPLFLCDGRRTPDRVGVFGFAVQDASSMLPVRGHG